MYLLRRTNVVRISTGIIKAGSTWTSDDIELLLKSGDMSLQWALVGSGTAKIEMLVSNNGKDFIDALTDIGTSITSTSGPGSDGKNIASIGLIPCSHAKIKVTETGSSNSITNIDLALKGY